MDLEFLMTSIIGGFDIFSDLFEEYQRRFRNRDARITDGQGKKASKKSKRERLELERLKAFTEEVQRLTVIDVRDNVGDTPLIEAARQGHCECLCALLDSGANPNVRNLNGETALIAASWEGHSQCVDILLGGPGMVEVNAGDYLDRTALFAATCGGHVECVKRIAAHEGVLVDKVNSIGVTPLMIAVMACNVDCVVELVTAGANIALETNSRIFKDYGMQVIAFHNDNWECLARLIQSWDFWRRTRRSRARRRTRANNLRFQYELAFGSVLHPYECMEMLCKQEVDSQKPNDTATQIRNLVDASLSITLGSLPMEYQIYFILTFLKVGRYERDSTFRRGLRQEKTLVRHMLISGHAPERVDWEGGRAETFFQYAFAIDDPGLLKYLLANLYLTPFDLDYLRRNKTFNKRIQGSLSPEMKRMHKMLTSGPLRLEVLCFLQIFRNVKKFGLRQKEAVRQSGIVSCLPKKFLRIVTFRNPIRHLCMYQWNKIEGDFLNFSAHARIWPTKGDMEFNSKKSGPGFCFCVTKCKVVKEDIDRNRKEIINN